MIQENKDKMQLTISHELLLLLRWLVTYEEEKLKKLIQKALHAGLQRDVQRLGLGKLDARESEEIESSIVDFFNLLEILLHESINEEAQNDAKHRQLMPAVDQIDSIMCDSDTIRSSLEKATMTIAANPTTDPKDALFQELLKNWKPVNKIFN